MAISSTGPAPAWPYFLVRAARRRAARHLVGAARRTWL